ncbi:MAG: hypothetical protein PVF58_15395 [Candidatus Methanofastidiosia archaeon]|jgi:tetratricopeptide (TPR) repeat protein
MKTIEILKKLFTEQELEAYLEKAHHNLQGELEEKDFTQAAFYSFDLAFIYQLQGDKKRAEHYYCTTIEYVDLAKFKPLSVKQECLNALGKHEKALEVALNNPNHTKLGIAKYYERAGKHDVARKLFAEVTIEESKKINEECEFFKPHVLQNVSDLWRKAQDAKKARKYNEQAVKAWEKSDAFEKSLYLIEEAWLYEEVGYIYGEAGKLETAMHYYEKAESKYEQAYTEDPTATGAHRVDGDWDFYREYFYVQFIGTRMFKLHVEHPMKYDQRRIKYRILNLEEQMKIK